MRNLRAFCLCLLLTAISLALPAARADFETPIALTNAKIVTASGEVIENGTIIIENQRIKAVGIDVEIPPHAEILDATDLIIYPGFIDANTHMGITRNEPSADERARVEDKWADVSQGPHSSTAQAFRRLMHPSWRAEDLFDPKSAKKDDFRKAGFTVALVSPKQAIFAGRSAVILMGDERLRRSVLKTDFAQHGALTRASSRGRFTRPRPSGGGSSGPRYPTTTMGTLAAFRQILIDARWHRQQQAWWQRHPDQERPPLDENLEALWPVLDGELPVVFIANRENEIHRALDMAAEFDLKPIIAGAREGWRVADRLKKENVPVILSLNWPEDPVKKFRDKGKKKGKKGKRPGRGSRRGSRGADADEEADTEEPDGEDAEPEEGEHEEDQPDEKKKKKPDPREKLKPIFDDEWEKKAFEPEKVVKERDRLWGEQVDNAKVLHDKGVNFVIGSFEMRSAGSVLKKLRLAIERGLPEDVAVAALTSNAAKLLGVDELIGDIVPGKLANLTVLTKPLSDEKSKVEWVFVSGKRFDASAPSKDGGRGGRGFGGGRRRPGEPNGEEEDQPDDEVASADEDDSEDKLDKSKKKAIKIKDAPTFRSEIEADRKPREQTGGNVLLKNATVLTITNGDMPNTDVLVQDGKIARIGKGLSAPDGVKTIDLSGYFLMPGIIDVHSHMCTEGGLNEGSMSVTCEVRVRDVIDHRDRGAFRALAGGVTMIHTMHGSANTIGGQNAVLRLKYGRPAAEWLFHPAPQTVKFALGENVKRGGSSRGGGGRFPGSRMGVEAVFRRSFDAARDYKKEWADFERDKAAGKDPRPVRRDLRLEALAAIHDGEIWVHCHCYRADEILRLLAMAEDYGYRISVLQHVLEGYRVIPEMHRHGCGASTFSDWWAYKIEAYDATPFNAARMTQGGVVATVNSDSAEVIRHLTLEAAKSLRFGGLSPNDALRLVTLNAAIQLGVERYVGSIEEGKLADLAVFDAHPLDTFAKCVTTLVDGEVFFQHEEFEFDAPPTPRPAKQFALMRAPLKIEPSSTATYWITGATIHPISSPPILNGAISISAGRITWVGANGDRRPPAGATVVDASGLHAYPGLINCGTSLGITEISSVSGTVDTSEIGNFQPDLYAVSAYNPHSALIGVTRTEGVTTAVVMGGRGTVAPRAGVVRLDGWSMPEAVIQFEVGLPVSVPSKSIEFPREMTEEQKKRDRERKKEQRERMIKIEDFFRKAQHYSKVKTVAEENPDLEPQHDPRLEAMIPYMRGEKPVLFQANSYKSILEAFKFAERYDLRPIIYGGREAWKVADQLAEKKIDVIITKSTTYPRGEFEPWDSIYTNAAVLAEAGVRFAFATGGASLAKHLGIEAGMAVAYGLDEERAMRALTLDAAEILGLGATHGSLEQSKTADIILTTDSPLQASNQVLAAFINGEPIDLANKHTDTDDKFQSRPQPNLGGPPELRGSPAMRLP